jgi:carbamoyl-phosphate synthase/aspartate carbamoyltransferase/dihydroorotase
MVLGSGVYRIGSSVEFDASCVGCVKQLRQMGHKTIMVNCNPETVSTDYDICDKLYFEEISIEVASLRLSNPSLNFRPSPKSTPLNILLALFYRLAVKQLTTLQRVCQRIRMFEFTAPLRLILTKPKIGISSRVHSTNCSSNSRLGSKVNSIRQMLNLPFSATTLDEAVKFCQDIYPCLVRPSYVLSGAAMNVAHDETELRAFLDAATIMAKDKPVVVSKFIVDAKEIDVDAVASNGFVLAMAISEHVENAGIHSGDATRKLLIEFV